MAEPYSTLLDPTRSLDNVLNLGYNPEALGVLSGAPVRWGNQPSGISGGARDSGEHNILSIQNTLETAADPGLWENLKGYFRVPWRRDRIIPTAEDNLNMARMLGIPGTSEYGGSIAEQSARQILPVMEGMINRPGGYLDQPKISPALQDTARPGYMQQGAHPWSTLLGALYGEEIGTTPHLGGVVWEKDDEGAWTGRPPERFLDYLGDTPEERVQEQRDMLALQREISGYVPPEPLGRIFRGDTGVGTDLQFTPEEAMTSNISNALMSAAQGIDVQPELQAIVDMSYVDPVLNDEEMFFEKYLDPTRQEAIDITSQVDSFTMPKTLPVTETEMALNVRNALQDSIYNRDVQPELQAIAELQKESLRNATREYRPGDDPSWRFQQYLDPTSQEVMDITTQEESFSAIQEADQQRMEREAKQEAARQEQVRADNQRRANEAKKEQDRARENRQAQKKQAAKARDIAAKSKAADDRKAAARAQARADDAAKKERQATIQRQEDQRRREATERAAAEKKKVDALLKKQMADMMKSMEEARRRRYTGGTGGALMWT